MFFYPQIQRKTPKNYQVIARIGAGEECVTGTSYAHLDPPARVGWSSAVFAFLVFALHQAGTIETGNIRDALKHADEVCAGRFPRMPGRRTRGQEVPVEVQGLSWAKVQREWAEATKKLGLISETPQEKPRLELWRGDSDLPGYISCIREKRAILQRAGNALARFCGGPPPRSLSIRITADPGTGKTSLVEALAKAFGLSLVSCDITQMVSRQDLVDFFEDIATAQTKAGTKLLIFVDEINALLDGNPVYSAFLTPLEGNMYVRRSKRFGLEPAVWVFAGTTNARQDGHGSDKQSDFDSRMTMIFRMGYHSLVKEVGRMRKIQIEREARLEQVYLGAHMIRRFHPDVREVSRSVLQFFWQFEPSSSPARLIRTAVSLLRNVQFGRVTRDNWLDREVLERIPKTKKGREQMVVLS